MLVSDWMHHPVHMVKPRDTIEHARQLMLQHRINQMPVVLKGELVGIVTDRDLRDAYPSVFDMAREDGKRDSRLAHPEKIDVESVMSHNTLSIGPSETLVDAATLMRTERIGSLPVLEDGKLVGILTRSDVLAAFIAIESGNDDEAAVS
jgi:acetoin utilization protein AcuB